MVNLKKLEETLMKNWTEFIDLGKVIATIKDCSLPISHEIPPKTSKSLHITLSQFSFQKNGAELWIDFILPKKYGIAIGTFAFFVKIPEGAITPIQTIGYLFKN